MVAVSPRAQGRGVGKKLFEVVMERADREGVPCYLESSKLVPNVGIYGRWGFELRMEMECVDDDGNGDGDGGGEGNEEGEGRCMVCSILLPWFGNDWLILDSYIVW